MIVLLHVLAAFGIVAALTVEWTGHALLPSPQGMRVLRALPYIGAPSGIALLGSGLWLAGTRWGWGVPWIDCSLGAMVGLALSGALITGRRMAALKGAEPGPEDLRWLGVSLRLRSGLTGAIAAMMVLKPELTTCLALVALGAAAALIPARREAVLP